MSFLLFCVILATAGSWAAPPAVTEKYLESINATGQGEQHVHLQRLVNSVEKNFVHDADEHNKMLVNSSPSPVANDVHMTVVNLTKQEGLENLLPLLPAFQVHDGHMIKSENKTEDILNKEKLILNNDNDETTTTATTITTLVDTNYNESFWETTTINPDIETATNIVKLADENENNSNLASIKTLTKTTTTTTTTTKTPLNELKETEKELKEKIAEIEAEPLILSARV